MNEFEKSFDALTDCHKGEIVYVIGGGWSLDEMDVDAITSDGVTIACNNGVLSLDKADYFFFTDGSIPYMEYYQDIETRATNVVFISSLIEFYDQSTHPNTYVLDRRENARDNWKFDAPDKRLLMGFNCVHCAVHLASIMGAKMIVLLGCDGDYKNNNKYSNDEIAHNTIIPWTFGVERRHGNTDMTLRTSNSGHQKIANQNQRAVILNASKGDGLTAYKRIKI